MSKQSTNETGVQAAGVADGEEERATQWVRLSKFEVTVHSTGKIRAPVYANGRQQIPVHVEIVAHNEDDDVVDLTLGQLKGIALLTYETGAPPPLWCEFYPGKNPLYEYNHRIEAGDADAGVRPLPEDKATRGRTFTWYTSASQMGAVKLAAAITSPSGVRYITNTQNPTAGKFDSWIIVDARAPAPHAWNELVMSEHVNAITNGSWDVDLYYIRFVKPEFKIVGGVGHNAGMDHAFYSWPKSGWARKSCVAFYPTPQARLSRFPSLNPNGVDIPVNDRPGQACAARVSSSSAHSIPQSSSWGPVTYYDQYGNSVAALIKPSSDGNTVSLVETGPHAELPNGAGDEDRPHQA